MKNDDRETSRDRRNFLKAAGAASFALAAAGDAFAQDSNPHTEFRMKRQPATAPDRGLWITWYDLPAEGRDAYLSWLHSTYLPQILKRPGYLWAAHYATLDLEGGAENDKRYKHVDDPRVGKGYHFMLLIGARDANVFGDPVPSVLHSSLPEEGKKMLAMRIGERVNLFTETGRHEGRALAAYKEGLTGAPCIQVGSFDCPMEYEEEMHAGTS